jgi:hypothetical protein
LRRRCGWLRIQRQGCEDSTERIQTSIPCGLGTEFSLNGALLRLIQGLKQITD